MFTPELQDLCFQPLTSCQRPPRANGWHPRQRCRDTKRRAPRAVSSRNEREHRLDAGECRGNPLAISRSCPPRGRPVGRLFRRPGREPGSAGSRRGNGGVSLPTQRQHALVLPDQRRNRRRDRGGANGSRRLRQRGARRNCVRRQHDDADVSSRASSRKRVSARRRDRRHGARSSRERRSVVRPRARVSSHGPGRPDRSPLGAARFGIARTRRDGEDETDRDRRSVERARNHQRPEVRRRPRTCPGRAFLRRRRTSGAASAPGRPGDRL